MLRLNGPATAGKNRALALDNEVFNISGNRKNMIEFKKRGYVTISLYRVQWPIDKRLSLSRLANHPPSMPASPMVRMRGTPMKDTWITKAEAVSMISKQSHHAVCPHHVQTLVDRSKIGTRVFPGGVTLFKRSDVEAIRVAAEKGKGKRL
jgi:hypothetical protein